MWRYPVKSLAGELLPEAQIDRGGLRGDRVVHVRGIRQGQARVVTGRSVGGLLPLLVATDAEVDRWGADRRRLRPNLVVVGARPLEERSWPGRTLHIGTDLVVGVDSVRLRCVVTTYDPDTGEQDLEQLRRIHHDFDSRLALNCWVIRPGRVRPGDEVEVRSMATTEAATNPGYRGWITGAPYAVG